MKTVGSLFLASIVVVANVKDIIQIMYTHIIMKFLGKSLDYNEMHFIVYILLHLC